MSRRIPSLHFVAAVLFALTTVAPFFADDKKDDGFVPMFNGKDLTGWVNVNCAPGTFFVKDGEVITTGKPTGYLRTDKQYENFIADFEWKHIPPKPGEVGNSGFFVWADPLPAVGTGYSRGIEVQVLVNLTYKNKKGEITATSQGDLFSIHGATCVPDRPHPDGWARCLPSENHCKGEGEWNHYRVEANDGVIKLTVNGHTVSGVSKCNPRKGYLALESEGSECRFRNLKIKELPSTNPKKEEIADVALGHKQLYTGLDLSGWKADDETKKHWQPKDWMLHYDGKGTSLNTEAEYGPSELIVDFKFPETGGKPCGFAVLVEKDETATLSIKPDGTFSLHKGLPKEGGGSGTNTWATLNGLKPAGQWNRLSITSGKSGIRLRANDGRILLLEHLTLPAKGRSGLCPEGEMDFANLFVRPMEK